VDEQEKETTFNKICKLWEVPLNFCRDFSIPMAEADDWDRFRASVLPLTIPISFCFLYKFLTEEPSTRNVALIVCAALAAPGLACSIYLAFCTKKTVAPPNIMFAMAVSGFVMSIIWISFTSDFVIDLLWIIGLILGIPKSVLGLTLLAVGNCLGDMQANVAMTKLGFGEMAITGCLAGPVFNILVGLGLSTLASLIDPKKEDQFRWSLYTPKGEVDNSSVIPLGLILALMVVLLSILVNGFANDFLISYKFHLASLVVYLAAVVGLCIFAFTAGVD
jgi:sodium/potassium/calcium exchanger 6